eukprot:283042-Alexandrium_andersonii.AAC.1
MDERWASKPGTTPAGSKVGERQVASGTTWKEWSPTCNLPACRRPRAERWQFASPISLTMIRWPVRSWASPTTSSAVNRLP